MCRRSRPSPWLLTILTLILVCAGSLQAQVAPVRPAALAAKSFQHPDMKGQDLFQEVSELPAKAATETQQRLVALGVGEATARLDARSGRFVTLFPTAPMIPGKGVGNHLRWSDLNKAAAPRGRAHEQAAWQAVRAFLVANQEALGVDLSELADSATLTSHDGGDMVQIHALRLFDGIQVRGSYVNAVVKKGNLILLGVHKWSDRGTSSNRPQLTREEATALAESFLSPLEVSGEWGKADRVYLALYNGNGPGNSQGYRYELVWSVKKNVKGDAANLEILVDAFTGEILSSLDTNQYAEIKGGVLPVTNDGIPPDGVEQAGWPMPFQETTLGVTDTGGNVAGSGSITTTFFGPFVNINDQCGADSLTQIDNVDWGTSGGTDCTTPGFGGAGNTHASRTGFYELNKIIEMGRGQLPSNSWLQARLTSNMNINNTCNAFWNGTVNFYRSGGGCFNTGEIAGVFDHEWGHGLDQNDATPGIASPSGEGVADIYTALRLNTSCIGRNFRATVCTGFGDPCLTCTGVRDIDYLKRASGQPHGYSWSNANCGGSVHCVGAVYAEAMWSLWKRELQSAPYNYDNNTAHEITTRLSYIGAGATGTWFSGGPPNGGCGGSSGYMNYLAADDDDGNLNNGTPHMTAIFNAFNDQEIACQTPTVQDSGCAGVPTTAPSVTANASDKSVDLSWGAVAGATSYQVFRTEGVFACDFGKVKLGETAGTTWNDTNLQNGRQYSYVVIPIGGNAACMGPASSCANATPASGPNLAIDTGSAALSLSGGDADAFLDNCENGTMTFDVSNTGLGTLTNVRIVGVTPSNAGVTVSTSFPSAISPSTLGEGATGSGSFSFTAGGLSFGETLTLQVEVTADELAASKLADLVVTSTETDLSPVASQTYSFESGTEGWTTLQGTFVRENGGGALGTTWFEQSSANLDNQCDQIQSPVMVLSATSTLTLHNNFDIEPFYVPGGVWYDRANVGVHEVATGSRTAVSPDGGRLYNASGANGGCGTTGQGGWADANLTWAASTWSAAALGSADFAGQEVQLDVRYGTDASLNGLGFRFDEVTVTDVSFLVPDAQSDSCGCTVNAECDDGLFCNGAETCVAGSCQAGTPPNCDDGVSCTVDSCDEVGDTCVNTADDNLCDNGLFCDGTETCDPVLDCQAGTAPNCDDGVGCTVDSCNEGTNSCDNTPSNALCDDGLFCNGAETCDPALDCQPGVDPCPGGTCNEAGNFCESGTVAQLEADCLSVGGAVTTVNLVNTYVSPVVVTTMQYSNSTTPTLTRVSSVTATSFGLRLQSPSGSDLGAENVCYLVVEEGTWTIDGFAVEAQKYTSTVTDDAPSNWVGEAQSYNQSYTNPVVLGQVMSENDPNFSVFWNQGATRTAPPSSSTLVTGKTVCEDTNITRADETVGFVVFEAGHGTIGGVELESALGADTVLGVGNAPPYAYTFNTAFATAPTVAVASMAAMDGNNGGWAQFHGATMATATTLNLSIDEDVIGDTERSHTSEQVGYVAFAEPVVYPQVGCVVNADCDDGLFCNGAETCVAGTCQAGTPPNCDDGVSCTVDSCDEVGDTCVNTPDDNLCDDGLFCNGAETCDPVNDCQAGTPPNCDDGVGCTIDSCNEGTDSCDNLPSDPLCDDGLFCNGAETCDPVLDCQAGTDPCPGDTCDEVGDVCIPTGPQAQLEWGSVTAGSTAATVSLTNTYTSPVVVTAVQYANNTTPVVTRISNVTATSFDVRLQAAGGGVVADNVSYLVVEEGTWTVNGVNIEAQTYTSTVTDENNSWVGEAQSYGQSYTTPAVVGQVMSENDPDWSVFWAYGSARSNPPSASALVSGKTVCEDTVVTRANETVGIVVFETAHGTLGGVEFESALGADTVLGVGNAPPYGYTFATAFGSAPTVAVVSLSGMDGGNGGWGQVHGATMATTTTLNLSVDEDTIGDTERSHITEQISYVVFASAGSVSP